MNKGKRRKNNIKTEMEQTIRDVKYREQNSGLLEGEGVVGGVKWVMGIKKGTLQNEHWVSYIRDESLASSPQTKNILYLN